MLQYIILKILEKHLKLINQRINQKLETTIYLNHLINILQPCITIYVRSNITK